MPNVHVAGFDGTPASRAAVDLAILLAKPSNGRVIAVTGYEAPESVLGKGVATGADALLAEEGRHEAAFELSELHVEGVERVTQPGPAAAALCAVAEREGASLIVVGVTHRTGLGRIAPGSMAERLVHGAPCAVAVAPAEHHAESLRKIAVAYDGSPESVDALTEAQVLAREHGAELEVLAVCEAPSAMVDLPMVQVESPPHDRMEADVREIVAELPAELHASGRVLTGRAGQTLVTACAEGVDLLVTGSRSYGPLRGALVGSISRHLVDHAPCPVLVVARGMSRSRRDAPASASTGTATAS